MAAPFLPAYGFGFRAFCVNPETGFAVRAGDL
jgi:hypothetical protein